MLTASANGPPKAFHQFAQALGAHDHVHGDVHVRDDAHDRAHDRAHGRRSAPGRIRIRYTYQLTSMSVMRAITLRDS